MLVLALLLLAAMPMRYKLYYIKSGQLRWHWKTAREFEEERIIREVHQHDEHEIARQARIRETS